MDETCRLRRGEGYGACIDEAAISRMPAFGSCAASVLTPPASSPETAEKLEHWYRQDGCRSKNEFLERAVNYYADHLAAGTSAMLPRAVQSAIDGRLQLLEQRLSSLLFKQAVELDMGLSILAECVNLDESVLRKQRAKSVNDVKRTNGQLRLEQKLRTQEPFDEWLD